MRPFEYLSNHVQMAVQRALLEGASIHFDGIEALQILDTLESDANDAQSGSLWMVTADEYAKGNMHPNLADGVERHLKSVTGFSESAIKTAIPMWFSQLVKIVEGLRADPHHLPMPKLQATDAIVNKPIPTFASPSDVVESLSAPDPSRRLRACFRFLADTSLAKAHKDRLRTAIEVEPLSIIRAVAQRALAQVSE